MEVIVAEVQLLNLAVGITEGPRNLLQCRRSQTIVAQIKMSQVRVWRSQERHQDITVFLCKAASFESVNITFKLLQLYI